MEQHKLVGEDIKLVLKENVLAVISSNNLSVVSSAIHNGGCKKTKTIINTQVFDEYGDRRLHDDPVLFIIESSKKLGNIDDFVGMVTYASIKDFSLVSKRDGDLAVSVIATAGCTHAESSGEEIEIHEIPGTINIIVIIDGNPTASCLTSTLITATEAKTAALRDLDLRKTSITDDGLANLKGMKELRKLTLFGTKISDAGMEHLLGLSKLETLLLSGSEVTEAGASRVQRAIPKVRIRN